MFQNFHFCGGYENGILRRRFFLSGGGGRVKKGKLQICKMAKCKTTTPKAAESLAKGRRRRRARFARPEYMQIYSAAREARRLQLRGAEGAEPVFCLHGGK